MYYKKTVNSKLCRTFSDRFPSLNYLLSSLQFIKCQWGPTLCCELLLYYCSECLSSRLLLLSWEKTGRTMMSAQPSWFKQHNALTTGIHVAFADAGLFHFEFLKTICVRKCEDVCPLWGAWVTERFIPSACLSKRCCGQGISTDTGRDVAGARGLRGFLTGLRVALSLWQREVTSRQRTGDRRTASQRHLHSFRTAAYPCTKNTPSWNALHPHSHTLSYTCMRVHTEPICGHTADYRIRSLFCSNCQKTCV